ncbi:hypothetical protein bsdcttw_04050 [Anaerocolumna chitinilytica]|uniref:Uncharacterized protein n=1 Tax=Anaerocolumna chitinilytica TaxID=1727145 RepID=A0A7I8DJ23_9FIRM|nr:hypothetical protein bsdcttw_04050 [Anaerocolumna chitinilytica]
MITSQHKSSRYNAISSITSVASFELPINNFISLSSLKSLKQMGSVINNLLLNNNISTIKNIAY